MAKGSKVTPKAKRRGWLKVTDAASGKTGWIYGRYAGGTATASSGGTARASRLGAGSSSDDESWLVRFGDWLPRACTAALLALLAACFVTRRRRRP